MPARRHRLTRACHLLHAAANLFAADETPHKPVQIPAFEQSQVQQTPSWERSAGNQIWERCESAVCFSHRLPLAERKSRDRDGNSIRWLDKRF